MTEASFTDTSANARSPLSDDDIKRLVRSSNADDRAVATHKICRVMERSELGAGERAAAQEIIRMLAQDAAELVRRALAVTLRTSELLPHDVAMRLAGLTALFVASSSQNGCVNSQWPLRPGI